MARINLKDRISQGLFFLDGAMGTQLFARGVDAGQGHDYLNISSPEVVQDIHKAYFDAGSDAVITNTFGANKYALDRHGKADLVKQINTAGAKNAREAAGEDKYVLGGLGPCGDFLAPVGQINPEQLKDAFAEQASALDQGDIDGFIIETMTALDEIVIAVEAVKSVSDLPIFASMSFDPAGDEFRTMMGVAPVQAVEKLAEVGVDAVGFNCGTLNMEGYVKLAEIFCAAVADKGLIVLAEANAGIPELVDGQAIYTLSPEEFGRAGEKIVNACVKIIGGCCGTGPAHIVALTRALK